MNDPARFDLLSLGIGVLFGVLGFSLAAALIYIAKSRIPEVTFGGLPNSDTILGGPGNDTLHGGAGPEILTPKPTQRS